MVIRFFAVAVVVILGAGTALADYLQLMVDIRNVNPFPPNKGNVPGAQGQLGGFGQPGVGFGGQQGGFPPSVPLPGGKKGKGFKPPVQPPPGPGNMPAPPGTTPPIEQDPLWVIVYLEIKGKPERPSPASPAVRMDHQFGKSTYIPVMMNNAPLPFLHAEQIKKESLASTIKKLRDGKDKKDLVQAAWKAWSYGLMKDFHSVMEDLQKLDAKHPVVTAYLKVQNQFKAKPPEDDPSQKGFLEEAKAAGYRTLLGEKMHYALLTNSPPLPANDAQIKRRLVRLENAMESFYYWFALQENIPVPPMPKHRLLGIVINDPVDFYKKNKSWGAIPMVGDGFTPRRDNIMVLAAKPLSEAYAILEQKNKDWRQTIKANPDELINGDIWKLRPDTHLNPMPFAIIQTMTVVQKAMEDEAERTTLSHEAVRQLLAASELLPRNVAAPEWIQEGLASYFERPFGAVYGSGGLPSWSHLVALKYFNTPPRSLGKGREVLLNVLSDRYFQIARDATQDMEEARDKMPEKIRDDWDRARATSWGLVYYLVKEQKLDRLFHYANEIGQMPRDLELTPPALEGYFARSFGLGDSKNALKLDTNRFQAFADSWVEYMKAVDLELPEVERLSLKIREENSSWIPTKDGPPPPPSKKGPSRPTLPPN